jgi:hypothetical protein
MGFSETKNSILKELVDSKKSKDKLLVLATTEKAAKENTLASKTTICENDSADLVNAENNQEASAHAKESAINLLADIELSCTNASELHGESLTMVEDAHHTASKAVSFALIIDELNTHINNEVKHNKVILNLLVKDSAKAVLDAKTAVTLASKALVDAITAATSVIHLNNSLNSTKTLIENTLPLITNKTEGLDELLEDLKAKAQKMYDQSLKEKKAAELALRDTTKKFSDATTEANAAGAALTAANLAVGQAN